MATIQPRLIRIRDVIHVEPFRIICRWSNGEARVNDFTQKVVRWRNSRNQELAQLADPTKFVTAFAQNGTIAFSGVQVDVGDLGLQPLDLDPDVLFAESYLPVESSREPVH
jgi:hypothetical protein